MKFTPLWGNKWVILVLAGTAKFTKNCKKCQENKKQIFVDIKLDGKGQKFIAWRCKQCSMTSHVPIGPFDPN